MAVVANIASSTVPNGCTTIETAGSWPACASFARPTDLTPYVAGDVISDSISVAAVLRFPTYCVNGQVLSAHITTDEPNVAAANLELLLFDFPPADHLDNGPLAVLAASGPFLVHRFNFPSASMVLIGSNVRHFEMDGASKFQQGRSFCNTSTELYGLLVTRTGFTPTASSKFHIRLSLQVW